MLADGLILSASRDLIRVILRRQGDTAEFRQTFGAWTAEDGSPVELESMLVGDHTDLACYSGFETQSKVHAAN
jgi:hypothetical protein